MKDTRDITNDIPPILTSHNIQQLYIHNNQYDNNPINLFIIYKSQIIH